MCRRCPELLAEIARLHDMLEIKARADLRGRLREYLGVTDQHARMLLRLYRERGGLVTYEDMRAAMPVRYLSHHGDQRCSDYMRVQVHKLRGFVGAGVVETIRGYGLRLTPKGCNVIARALVADVSMLAAA